MIDDAIRTQAADVLAAARDKGVMLATAESCTGGLVSAALTEIAGSSDVLDRGYVTYSNRSKTELLGVPADLIKTFGAVSEQVARAMAEGALERSGIQLALSITGVAGPGMSERKPAGLVWFGVAARGRDTQTFERRFPGTERKDIRLAALQEALTLLRASIG